ncbi:hypothetical protein RJ45_21915 [Photobacterium gaetbulicola]|uniref:Transferase n=1 Tax=Photobacterium gaetbulicola TaxID=1295392 RepID=A0A0B9FYM2_9GAMM|nr:hypothetical protein RJ45_21915 [Photobacterium gaetbulicola]
MLSFVFCLPWTLYFNFKYLPREQALKLPIVLFKPSLLKTKGTVKITSKKIYFGMIQLGVKHVSIYPNNGFIFENKGGEIEFKGRCVIGSNSSISIGDKGKLIIGDDFLATSTLKIVCYHYVKICERVRFGWDCLVMDTGFHPLKSQLTGEFIGKAYGPIKLGKNNWFANGTLVLKNTETADFCIFGARSILSKKFDVEPYSLLVGSPPKVVKTGIYRDMDDCTEVYEAYEG